MTPPSTRSYLFEGMSRCLEQMRWNSYCMTLHRLPLRALTSEKASIPRDCVEVQTHA
jgi:hypothetical protein